MASMFTVEEPRQVCPTCRASYPYGIARCAFCGSNLPRPPEAATADPPESVAAPESVTEPEPQTPHEAIADAPEPLPHPEPPLHCEWCGAARADGAQRCPGCGATYLTSESGEVPAWAALELQVQAARVNSTVRDQEERAAGRWRWASWALARIILRWPGNL